MPSSSSRTLKSTVLTADLKSRLQKAACKEKKKFFEAWFQKNQEFRKNASYMGFLGCAEPVRRQCLFDWVREHAKEIGLVSDLTKNADVKNLDEFLRFGNFSDILAEEGPLLGLLGAFWQASGREIQRSGSQILCANAETVAEALWNEGNIDEVLQRLTQFWSHTETNLLLCKPWWDTVDSFSFRFLGRVYDELLVKALSGGGGGQKASSSAKAEKQAEKIRKHRRTFSLRCVGHEDFWVRRLGVLLQNNYGSPTAFPSERFDEKLFFDCVLLAAKEALDNAAEQTIVEKGAAMALRTYSVKGSEKSKKAIEQFLVENAGVLGANIAQEGAAKLGEGGKKRVQEALRGVAASCASGGTSSGGAKKRAADGKAEWGEKLRKKVS